jgi:hypothetical protein
MGSADGHPRDLKSRPDEEAGAALAINLNRQRQIADGLRVVNTQGRESIALADAKYQKAEDEDVPGWMA